MNIKEIMKLIKKGEKIDIEFKESKESLSKNIYDTVCAFNNRNGGHIILGINDKREIVGIKKTVIEKIIKEFTTSINNPQKIYPPLYLYPKHFTIQNKNIIYIYVPKGDQVCRHNGKIWDRSFEGDINITNHLEAVYKMFARKHGSYFTNKVYPNLNINFLDTSLIEKAKKMALGKNKNHIWKNMNYEEILRSSNLILEDPETKKEGLTLAAILLFGKDNSIMSVLPQHRTDAIFRVVNKDRYDDRDVIITNIIDSYDRLIKFGQKHLNDLFVLDGILNVNARDMILREIVSNTLAHRDYSSGFPARMIIDEEKIVIENSNLANGIGPLNLKKFSPFSKNPTISKFFREIGLADELGSGMRNTYKYTKLYSGSEPIFEEGDIFKTIIPLKKIATLKVGASNNENFSSNTKKNKKTEIYKMIKENKNISRKQIATVLKISEKTVSRYIKEIYNLKYVGKGSNGYWEFSENTTNYIFNTKIIEFIKKEVRKNKKITRQSMADKLNINIKIISKHIKEIPNLKYIGKGINGHWELLENVPCDVPRNLNDKTNKNKGSK